MDLCVRSHPVQPVQSRPKRVQYIAGNFLGLNFGFSREMLLDVYPADGLPQRFRRIVHTAFPTLPLLRDTGNRMAVEREVLVGERLRQKWRAILDRVESQIVLPVLQWFACC